MTDMTSNLEESWSKRKAETKKKALDTIREMQAEDEPVNFNSVHNHSGISKNYLYNEPEIRKIIEECRQQEKSMLIARQAKYDKTLQSKDVIIQAKEKRIAKLEKENQKLKRELEVLRGMLYNTK
jgi:zona occludens toxin (predicted ATPase)